MVSFEAKVNAKGIVEVSIEADSIEEIVKALPSVQWLFSAEPERLEQVEKQVPKWVATNIEAWEKAKERNKIIYAMFLMRKNKPMLLEEIKDEAKNLGVNLDDWIAHNFKRDMKGDVVEVEREGRKRLYKLSAVGLRKVSSLKKEIKV